VAFFAGPFVAKNSRAMWQWFGDLRPTTVAGPQSALIPRDFTILAHFSFSAAITAPNAAGVRTKGVASISSNRAFIVGSADPALISALSLAMISEGVPFRTPTPVTELTS
jgi:hypothetical protein